VFCVQHVPESPNELQSLILPSDKWCDISTTLHDNKIVRVCHSEGSRKICPPQIYTTHTDTHTKCRTKAVAKICVRSGGWPSNLFSFPLVRSQSKQRSVIIEFFFQFCDADLYLVLYDLWTFQFNSLLLTCLLVSSKCKVLCLSFELAVLRHLCRHRFSFFFGALQLCCTASLARLSSVCLSVCHRCILAKR